MRSRNGPPPAGIVATVVALTGVALCASAGLPTQPGINRSVTSQALERFLRPDPAPLTSYRALRRLAAATRGGRMQASLVAWTELRPDRGFRYEILSQTGAPSIQKRVFLPVLEAEAKSVASGGVAGEGLTRANYRFDTVAAREHGLLRIGIAPQRHAPMLIVGAIFLQPGDGDLVRVEGRLVKGPSFWIRRADVVRQYARVAGVRVPIEMRSTASVRVVGASTFAMTWEYESVNGRAVGSPRLDAMATSGRLDR